MKKHQFENYRIGGMEEVQCARNYSKDSDLKSFSQGRTRKNV